MRRPGKGRGWAAAAVLLLGAAAPAGAQGVTGSAQTNVRYLEIRPIRQDTVSRERVTQRTDGGLEFEGFPVFCVTETDCVFYRSQPVQHGAVLTQDVELTAWGLGVTGLSASLLLRGRTALGGEFSYPRVDDPFDAVLAYLELNRERYRVRAGRQRTLSGLGASSFDGLGVLVEPRAGLRVEAFGGRSLAPGLSEPRHHALRGLDDFDFLLEREAVLLGAELGAEPAPGSALTLRYQREIWTDRSGLLSERASLSARTTALRPVLLFGAADYDFAFGRLGKAHLRAQLPLPAQRLTLEATARRYVPYFELWTIWGLFSPVAYHEALLQASWQPRTVLALWLAGGYRRFDETHAPVFLEPLKDASWRAEAGGRWQLSPAFALEGSYRLEGPVGAFLSAGDASLAYRPGERLGVWLRGTALQQIEEFRVGEGALLGGGAGLDIELRRGARLAGGIDVFRQTRTRRPAAADWNQRRGWLSLEVGFGRDPGRQPHDLP